MERFGQEVGNKPESDGLPIGQALESHIDLEESLESHIDLEDQSRNGSLGIDTAAWTWTMDWTSLTL